LAKTLRAREVARAPASHGGPLRSAPPHMGRAGVGLNALAGHRERADPRVLSIHGIGLIHGIGNSWV